MQNGPNERKKKQNGPNERKKREVLQLTPVLMRVKTSFLFLKKGQVDLYEFKDFFDFVQLYSLVISLATLKKIII